MKREDCKTINIAISSIVANHFLWNVEIPSSNGLYKIYEMHLEKQDMDISSIFVESTTDYKYHDDYNRAEEMLRMSIKQETSLTFSILIIALASLFASDPLLGNQQALAQGVGG